MIFAGIGFAAAKYVGAPLLAAPVPTSRRGGFHPSPPGERRGNNRLKR
jgi:hypothetical protein